MDSARRTALVAGLLYLVTHVAGIAGSLLYEPVLSDPGYVAGPGADTQVLVAAILEVVVAVAIVGTAVALYPVVKRHNEGISLGYAGLRTVEASVIVVGVAAILGVVTLRQEGDDSLVGAGRALTAFHEWTFVVGPNFVLSCSTLLMAYLMFRSRLVPRFIGLLGLVGGVLILASAVLLVTDVYEPGSAVSAVVALPVFAWELSFAFWLVFKGFRPEALAAVEPG